MLHEAVDMRQHHVLSIRNCTSPRYFDGQGNLSVRGKLAFWHEVDNLLERFDVNEVKLLPQLHLKQKHSGQMKSTAYHYSDYHNQSAPYHQYRN